MAWSIFTQGGGKPAAAQWSNSLLQQMGLPQTPQNQQFLYDWQLAEGGGGKNNPLNQGPVPGQPKLTTTGSQYGGGAADYASTAAGLQGAADYLHMPAYKSVLAAMQAGGKGAAPALWASPWAASHYGNGKSWPGGVPPVVKGSPAAGPASLAASTAAAQNAVNNGGPTPAEQAKQSGASYLAGFSPSNAADNANPGGYAGAAMLNNFDLMTAASMKAAQPPIAGQQSAPAAAAAVVGTPGGNQTANLSAVKDALTQKGVPYQWGGTTPGKGLDCSGLVQYAWGKAGVSIPRTTYQQIASLPKGSLNSAQWQPGDLIYPDAGHVGMYIGNGQIVEAPHTGTVVQVVSTKGWTSPVAVRRP